jgi:[acyl-carrier-protein] S-malonyltransferase
VNAATKLAGGPATARSAGCRQGWGGASGLSEIMALFPGMAAGHAGMGQHLMSDGAARDVFATFSRASGVDVAALACDATPEELERDRHWELATVACEMAATASYRAAGGRYGSALGFSIGAYAALASAGVIAIDQIVAMIDVVLEASRRLEGRFAMMAVLGLPAEALTALEKPGRVEMAAVLTANHHLVAGREGDVVELGRRVASAALKVTRLAVRWPLHTSLMRPVSDALAARRLGLGGFHEPSHPILSLHHGRVIGTSEECWELLVQHLCSPQRLDVAVAAAQALGVKRAVELGPGTTLSRAIRWLARDQVACEAYTGSTAAGASAQGSTC